MELHCVNKTDKNEYVDYTTDFNGEKYKWFLPFESQRLSSDELVNVFKLHFGHIQSEYIKAQYFGFGLPKCRCCAQNHVADDKVFKTIKTLTSNAHKTEYLF
jgi:hypothetical protein